MVGKIISEKKSEGWSELTIEEIYTKKKFNLTVDPSVKYKVGSMVSTYATVTEIVNHNFDYEYPKGTIGT